MASAHDDDDDDNERRPFSAVEATVMSVSSGNRDRPDGDPAIILTLALHDSIEQIVITLKDARLMVCEALIALAMKEDAFAQRLLDDHFESDGNGHCAWPSEPFSW